MKPVKETVLLLLDLSDHMWVVSLGSDERPILNLRSIHAIGISLLENRRRPRPSPPPHVSWDCDTFYTC